MRQNTRNALPWAQNKIVKDLLQLLTNTFYKTFRIAKSLSNMKQSHAFSGVQMANDMAQLTAENKVWKLNSCWSSTHVAQWCNWGGQEMTIHPAEPEKENLRRKKIWEESLICFFVFKPTFFQIQDEVTFISVTSLYVFSTKINFILLLFRSYENLSTLFIKLFFKYIFNSCI